MIKQIKKRDSRVVVFEPKKITRVIVLAGKATGEFGRKEAKRLAGIVVAILEKSNGQHIPEVEQVQDVVEQVLMAAGHYATAKAFILYRERRAKERVARQVMGVSDDVGMSMNALKVMARRYLLKDGEGRVIETPKQALARVARVVAAVEKKQGKEWQEKFEAMMVAREFMPAGCYFRGAGTKSGMLSNCFVLPVEDSIEDIFEAVKWTAQIHAAGGGCIAAGSQVITSYCGLENFEVLYDRLGGKKVEVKSTENGWSINIADKNIRTLAFDSKTGRLVQDKILEVWRYKLPKERVFTIHSHGGFEVTTSDWHPFFVYEDNGVVEKRADEIVMGDRLIASNSSIFDQWLFNDYQIIDSIRVDEEIGWLVGYVLGDGSFGTTKTNKRIKGRYVRLRLFDGNKDTLIKAGRILSDLTGEGLSIQKDSRNETYVLTCVNQRVVGWLQKLTAIFGPKGGDLRIPGLLIKSPIPVVMAVLAGLLDSDGYVSNSRPRVNFDTESGELAEQIVGLLAVVGIRSQLRKKKPVKSHWRMMYEVIVDGAEQIRMMRDYLDAYLISELKRKRLIEHAKQMRVWGESRSPLTFIDLAPFLEKVGVPINSTAIHRHEVYIGQKRFWLHEFKWGGKMAVPKMIEVLKALLLVGVFDDDEQRQLNKWLYLHQSVVPVVKISRPRRGGEFYDFTTEKYHNYLAGKQGLAVVHNTGYNFSHLRPKGDRVGGGGLASGPVNFMRAFDTETSIVMQGGTHRGANMGILNADHPDITEFITCKTQEGEITNFNISVGATDAFMEAVVRGKSWNLVNPRDGRVVMTVAAKKLFDQMVQLAWKTGDPGMIFLDNLNKNNPLLKSQGPIESTNVCGEVPLYPFEPCNLGSINLAKFVSSTGSKSKIDWERLEQVTRLVVRFLDDGVDASNFPLKQIREAAIANRRIGVGVMGWAEMLYQLKVRYDSEAAVRLAGKVMGFIQRICHEESEKLAREKGVFPNWKGSEFEKMGKKRRNVAVTTIAPTGTISMVADCSSGIEPVFGLSYVKNVVDEAGLTYTNAYFEQALTAALSDGKRGKVGEVLREVVELGSVQGVAGVPKWIKEVFRVAYDIAPEWHVKMQAAFQEFTDNAVSKTINFPVQATVDDIEKAYILAWKWGCKGITVYRDQSKAVQILSTKSSSAPSTSLRAMEDRGPIIQSKLQLEPLSARAATAVIQETGKCPECGGELRFSEGCETCNSCGYSHCAV